MASIGFPPVARDGEALSLWNWYLRDKQLPEVNTVGTGLPDTLRDRDGGTNLAATVLLAMGTPVAGPSTAAGPSTSASRAAPIGPAVAGPSFTPIPRTSRRRPRDSDGEASDEAGGQDEEEHDEGQPPRKKQRVDDGGSEREEEDSGGEKGKNEGKGKARGW